MKAILFNGSGRNGNTRLALETIAKGIKKNINKSEVSIIHLTKRDLRACDGCGICKKNGSMCVHEDETNDIMQALYDADFVVFGTPVYWGDMSGQMKIAVDKMYSKSTVFKQLEKKIGIVMTGGAPADRAQYQNTANIFRGVCKRVGWEVISEEIIVSEEADGLSQDKSKLVDLMDFWKKFQYEKC